ncbi:peptidyl-prolyl cis-trans isomerase, FKBP-type family protein [Tritrichomonas foetus]|uniref:peptidylprolyl isomerase n=1 Tax=Tritrichomonas foetus TaxID=1144522 RepID=A0A1J4KSJ9_9EUKA|nr:peptidyl-prolyl cis-trans isomerase, FKBP-type family protein [Tritrichomonas foetus]|eukprot:OHT12638.1 peptidyl-prolyl cis-trans isomerase, FKBP-type family protein [Tritrichomonas foetus]
MHVGEISIFHIDSKYAYGKLGKQPDIPADEDLIFEIELLDILVGPTKQEKAVQKAREECERGIVAFREGRLDDALNDFCQGRLTLMFEGKDDSDPSYFSQEYADIKIRLNRNLAVAYARKEDYTQSLQYANEVLEFVPNDTKCLLKKCEALVHLERLVEARQTLSRALGVSHNDPVFRPVREKLEALEKEERIRQNETFKKMTKKDEQK